MDSPLQKAAARRSFHFRLLPFLLGLVIPTPPPLRAADSADEFFEKKIRPILEEHCLECHSPKHKVKGGLRLDSASGWRQGGDSGPALIPGNPDQSLLLRAVRYREKDLQMPPRKKLAAADIAALESWVQSGARDPRIAQPAGIELPSQGKALDWRNAASFWSYRPPHRHPLPPTPPDRWPEGTIDHFLFAKMNSAGVSPASDADPQRLLRRLHFTLCGLPPSPSDFDAFVRAYTDNRKAAVAQEVDRLLEKPEFAEAFARRWLDLVRFAESSGGGRTLLFKDAWRYRDYVLQSLRDDLPWNRFIAEQIAGDLLPAPTPEERARLITATGFLALGPTNYEEQDKQQLRFDIIDEQLETLGKAFLGQTIGCARCHDHKFDPIPQRDYYALAGILSSTQTLLNLTDNVARWIAEPLPGHPEEERLAAAHTAKLNALKSSIREAKTEVARLNSAPAQSSKQAAELDTASLPGIVLDDTEAKLIGSWKRSTFTQKHVGASYLNDENSGKGEKTATFTPKLPDSGRYEVRFAYTALENRAREVRVTVFHADGEETILVDQTEEPSVDGYFISLGTYRFEKDGAGYVLVSNGGTAGYVIIDAVQFLPDTLSEQPEHSAAASKVAVQQSALKQARERLSALNKQLKELEKNAPQRSTAMRVRDSSEIRDTEIRIRGQARQKGAVAPRGFLRALVPPDSSPTPLPRDQSGRLQLAEWLTSDQNPLTARVLVNRVWAWLFGKGLVLSTENFGTTGEAPSHPELLDDLASRFMQNKWSLRWLVREIVTSHAWRLSSDPPTEADPSNTLLSRFPLRRLDADQIRDAMLEAGGALQRNFGGPNIAGASEINANDSGAANVEYQYVFNDCRRSLYTPAFRNKRHELFEVFDFADINSPIGLRETSTVAPQALFLLNSPFAAQQARRVGERFADPTLSDAEQVQRIALAILSRELQAAELEPLLQLHHLTPQETLPQKLTRVAHALFASVDFRFLR
jgi:hypothetical protein